MNANAQPSNDPVKILVAEDSPTQTQQLQHILEKQSYEVGVASNGRLALEMAPQFQPALIISDVVMPEMDGYELCRRIKEDSALRDIPVILVTTMSDPQDVIRGLECGADNFVLKPYEEHYLLGRVRYVLANREINHLHDARMGVDLYFHDKRHYITAGRLQILNLLLSTYDAAIQRNKELNRSQEELEQRSAQLETANKELESFSYSVSHDLRAPLRAIDGYAQMLEEDHLGRLNDEGRRMLRAVRENATKMARLIDDLLMFSRLGRSAVTPAQIDMEALAREVAAELPRDGVSTRTQLRIEALPPGHGDRALLRQIWVNLLGNAFKYSGKRDEPVIEVSGRVENGECIYCVKDNGAGFDMRYYDKLFGVFQRLHGADEFAGTGVGLAIVQRVAARHGGRVWAEGKPDAGASFYFSLPIKGA